MKKIRFKLHLISTCKSTPIIRTKKSTWNTPGCLVEHVSTNFTPQLHVDSTWCACWVVGMFTNASSHYYLYRYVEVHQYKIIIVITLLSASAVQLNLRWEDINIVSSTRIRILKNLFVKPLGRKKLDFIFKKINILFTRYALLLMFTDRNYS